MTNADAPFDPLAPLPGPPDPWASTDTPSLRSGPPYHLTEMIAAEPAIAGRILARHVVAGGPAAALADAVRAAAVAGTPILVTGCGTSEHAALGIAEILRDAGRAAGLPGPGALAAQAFELALDPPSSGLVIGVSHEGGTGATIAALAAARSAGARTALLTVSRRSPGAAFADAALVLETGELDQSWCHTVGYVSPMLAAAAVGAHVSGRPLEIEGVVGLLAAGTRDEAGADRIAGRLADAAHLLVVASGIDRTAGRELVLKVEEASWLPSAFRDLETFLHGHLPATGRETGLILILTDRDGRPERVARARQALAAARVIGIRTAAIVASELDGALTAGLTPAGRLLVPDAPGLPSPVASLFGSATPLQLLTERLARARGTNPDPIRRDDPAYRAAADAADG
jgi:glucosamine--fructose-6-phosphate aminotransferase (isomerizing)